jgi:apolipoprotein N-acyltransferase
MRAFGLLLAASTGTSLGIVYPALWWMVFPGLALFFLLLRSHTGNSPGAALYGLIFGSATGGAATIWFLDTLPLSFLGIRDPGVQWLAVSMTWLYVAVSLGFPVMIGAVSIWLIRASRWFPLLAASLWVLIEIGRMWSFAITTWGPGSLFGPHFSAASIGYPLTENLPLAQLAYPLGIDALNLFVGILAACISVAPSVVRHPANRAPFAATTTLGLILSIPSIVTAPSPSAHNERPLRFAIISENIEDVRDQLTHHP